MELHICGGIKEHGRNCFLIKNEKESILFDCGIKGGLDKTYPRISADDFISCQHIFLSHSHLDHSGALSYAEELGFSGTVWCSKETYHQLKRKPKQVQILEECCSENTWYKIHEHLCLRWGSSGHCAGSVWFTLKFYDKTILYSGDYEERNQAYPCLNIRNEYADLAILDCAYGYECIAHDTWETRFITHCKHHLVQGKKILLPLPLHGRAHILYPILKQISKKIAYRDEFFLVHEEQPWSLDENKVMDDCDILCIADAQLMKDENKILGTTWLAEGNIIILTGECDASSYAHDLLDRQIAEFFRIPVHQDMNDIERLMLQNHFQLVIPFHNKDLDILIKGNTQETLSSTIIF